MATTDRARAGEGSFQLDQETAFKTRNRRNKLLGHWLATEYLGLSGDDAAAYAKSIVLVDFEKPGDDDVTDKIKADLEAAGKSIDDAELNRRLGEFTAKAKAELAAEA